MVDRGEIISLMALQRLCFFNLPVAQEVYNRLGSAQEIIAHSKDIRKVMPDATPRLVDLFKEADDAIHRSTLEYKWDIDNGVFPLCISDERYPQRLKNCEDAPFVLFYMGSANLNKQRVINIVGTRHCTTYGQDIIRKFIADLKNLCPQVLIVSGLAYGVDINAHREALQNSYDTVAVLAHGLDDIYPPRHRETAKAMIKQGGLLTEFPSCTNADKMNFVRRNRIVAGMSDATILVESASHGGGLITTRIARDYNRDVFAFPGSINAPYSAGCNNLIRDNGAALISNAKDFVKAMGWETDAKLHEAQKEGIERQLFPAMSQDEKKIVELLQKNNDLQANIISVKAGIAIGPLTALLFSLEMKGVVKAYAGNVYHLLN